MNLSTLMLLLALAGCASKVPVPAWKADAGSSLKAFSNAYLKGDTALAQTEFTRARGELASTGRPDLVAHAELYRCATQVASIEYGHCPGFAAVAQDATPALVRSGIGGHHDIGRCNARSAHQHAGRDQAR